MIILTYKDQTTFFNNIENLGNSMRAEFHFFL